MKNHKVIFSLVFCLFLNILDAQEVITNYNWIESPVIPTLTKGDKLLSEVILKEYLKYEYKIDEKGVVIRCKTYHKQTYVVDDKGIEANNKVYVPFSEDDKIVTLKARTISPSGKVSVLQEDKIEVVNNLENYGSFQLFAFEGLQKGSVVEYYFVTVEANPSLYGNLFVQKNEKVLDFTFCITSPKKLVFETFGVNGVEGITDTIIGDERIVKYKASDIIKYTSEKYSAQEANIPRIDFNFVGVQTEDGKYFNRGYNWEKAATTFHNIYWPSEKKKMKLFSKSLKKMGVVSTDSDKKKVKLIEYHLKSQDNFIYDKKANSHDIAGVFSANRVGDQDLIKLFTHYLTAANVNFEIVFTSDRFSVRFEKENENWSYLQKVLLYIPSLDIYIGPSDVQYRDGLVNPMLTENYGLFISAKQGIVSSKVKWIKGTEVNDNGSIMDLEITFDELMQPQVFMKDIYKGHEGVFFKSQATFGDKEQLKQFYRQVVKSKLGKDAILGEVKATGESIAESAIDFPFGLETSAKVSSLIEVAGDEYLFKIGEVIGEQVQMYQENERVFDAEVQFPHYYKRTIKFTIPEGYKVSGLEALTIDLSYGSKESKEMGFISNYTVTGNVIYVEVYEFYNKTSYKVIKFEEFREVINAAADFNKLVILISKK